MKLLSRVWLFATPWTVASQAPPSMEFSWQEYWRGLPWPSPGDLPDPGIEPRSPTLQADALPSEPPRKPTRHWRPSQILNVFKMWPVAPDAPDLGLWSWIHTKASSQALILWQAGDGRKRCRFDELREVKVSTCDFCFLSLLRPGQGFSR